MSDASLHPDMLMNRVFAETGLTAAKQLHDIIRRPARMAHPSPAELRAARYGISGIAFVAHGARDFSANAFYGIDALSDVMCFVERDDDDTQPQLPRHVIHSAFFNDLHGAAMR